MGPRLHKARQVCCGQPLHYRGAIMCVLPIFGNIDLIGWVVMAATDVLELCKRCNRLSPTAVLNSSHMAKMLSAAKRIYRMRQNTDLLTNDMMTMISFRIGVGRFFQNANHGMTMHPLVYANFQHCCFRLVAGLFLLLLFFSFFKSFTQIFLPLHSSCPPFP